MDIPLSTSVFRFDFVHIKRVWVIFCGIDLIQKTTPHFCFVASSVLPFVSPPTGAPLPDRFPSLSSQNGLFSHRSELLQALSLAQEVRVEQVRPALYPASAFCEGSVGLDPHRGRGRQAGWEGGEGLVRGIGAQCERHRAAPVLC